MQFFKISQLPAIANIEMTRKSEDEYFSADSLEKFEEAIKKESIKSKNVVKRKKRKTYTELNQIYLLREFMKIQTNAMKSNSCGCDVDESIKYPSRCSSNENVDENLKGSCALKQKRKSKIPRILWSQYLSNQYKSSQSVSLVNSETRKLRNRIEYGQKMSSMNRINQQCQKLHKRINSNESSHPNNSLDCKASKSVSSIIETTKNYSKALKSSSPSKDVNKNEEFEMKLECMQIRHQNDRKKIEKLKNALMNERTIGKEQYNDSVAE
ncbi:hypothetical protein ACKWTF_012458 [Chironomus riparius]